MAGEQNPTTYTQEQVDAMIAERITSEVSGLKTSQQELLKESKAAKARLAAFEGVDPTEYKTLKEAAAEAEKKKALAEGNLEVWKKQVTDQHAKEMQGKDQKLTKYQSAIERRVVQARLAEALAKHDADPSMIPLLQLEGARFIRVKETDEDFEEQVVDGQGNPLVADGKGTPMTVDDLVAQTLKTKYPAAFRGSGSSGGGAAKSNGGAGGATRVIAPKDIMAHIDDVAAGKVKVSMG